MNIWKVLTGVLFIAYSSTFVAQNVSTDDWQRIDEAGLFSFKLPAGFTKRDRRPTDETTGEYSNGSINLIWKWRPEVSLPYAQRRQASMSGYDETTTRIRGLRGNIRRYWLDKDGKRIYRAELNVGNWEKGEIQLYMALESADSSSLEIANQIFQSVVFPMPSPERP